jgi:two-component system cell cycle sensor histidine kinase/response regulator CckA
MSGPAATAFSRLGFHGCVRGFGSAGVPPAWAAPGGGGPPALPKVFAHPFPPGAAEPYRRAAKPAKAGQRLLKFTGFFRQQGCRFALPAKLPLAPGPGSIPLLRVAGGLADLPAPFGDRADLSSAFPPVARGHQRGRSWSESNVSQHRNDEDERRLAATLAVLPDAVLLTDPEGRVTFRNRAAEALTGWTRAELIGLPLAELLRLRDEHTREAVADPVAWALPYGPVGAGAVLERRDGGDVAVRVVAAPLDSSPGTLLILRDVTEARRAEDRIRLADKTQAIEQLAGGVAHNFNNLLTIVNGNSDLLAGALDAGHPWRPFLEEIRKAGERAADLTRQLLAFSRKQLLQPRVLDLNQFVAGLAPALQRLVGARIELATELDPAVPSVCIDPGQIEQVLRNLAANARDAMPQGGTLTIETAGVVLTEGEARGRPGLWPGRCARLLVRDTGRGMSEAVRARAFEPFFTTRPVGQGTGLGLASAYGIVRQSGGCLEASSSVGHGTTFTIYLPAAEGSEAPAGLMLSGLPHGTEAVLLVEDEPMVRELNRTILKMCGYTVLEASDGQEALRVSAAHTGAIDLLLTDVQMPRLNGPELAQALAAQRPQLKVLFLSGVVSGEELSPDEPAGGAGFLAKPYAPIQLAQKIREVLEAGPVKP